MLGSLSAVCRFLTRRFEKESGRVLRRGDAGEEKRPASELIPALQLFERDTSISNGPSVSTANASYRRREPLLVDISSEISTPSHHPLQLVERPVAVEYETGQELGSKASNG